MKWIHQTPDSNKWWCMSVLWESNLLCTFIALATFSLLHKLYILISFLLFSLLSHPFQFICYYHSSPSSTFFFECDPCKQILFKIWCYRKIKNEKLCYVISMCSTMSRTSVSTSTLTLQANTYAHTLMFIITEDVDKKPVLAQFKAWCS